MPSQVAILLAILLQLCVSLQLGLITRIPICRMLQIKYDDGKEEELEWLDLEPRLLIKGTAQTRPRYKNVDELVYAKPKRSGKQGRRR